MARYFEFAVSPFDRAVLDEFKGPIFLYKKFDLNAHFSLISEIYEFRCTRLSHMFNVE